MKRVLLIFSSLLMFMNIYAHSPNIDSVDIYIDNIWVGEPRCVCFRLIPTILLENYYLGNLFQVASADSLNADHSFSLINPKFIKQTFIKANKNPSICKSQLHIRTKKAKDGFLSINNAIMNKITEWDCDFRELTLLYVYNNQSITTKKGVKQLLRLRERQIQKLNIVLDKQSKIIYISIQCFLYEKTIKKDNVQNMIEKKLLKGIKKRKKNGIKMKRTPYKPQR